MNERRLRVVAILPDHSPVDKVPFAPPKNVSKRVSFKVERLVDQKKEGNRSELTWEIEFNSPRLDALRISQARRERLEEHVD